MIEREPIGCIIDGALVGLAVGDALGVPVEFQSREHLDRSPVCDMRGHGTHNQPAGTWSDDTSLTLCLVESLCECGVDYHDQAARFSDWLVHGTWTPHGQVFDVGLATSAAIQRLQSGTEPTLAGSTVEASCGNGSLMRILPIAIYLAYAKQNQRMEIAMMSSRLTHGHLRCQLACAMLVEIAAGIIRGQDLPTAVADSQKAIQPYLAKDEGNESEEFRRLLCSEIDALDRSEISGSGYVIHCLESSLWCALHANDYRDGVLAAVNLGDDTDTTGAVTGGLLGLLFGIDRIPDRWVDVLARKQDIFELSKRFQTACLRRWDSDRQIDSEQIPV